jgi:hypothetical protein
MRKAMNAKGANGKSKVCYAIYTRKSSEEGLELEFNSLDAQHEACEAFILSQKHQGWVALPEMYDDGGISGATMDRPASWTRSAHGASIWSWFTRSIG